MFSNSFTGTYSDVTNFPLSKLQRPNISYDTSSKDPQMLRSRIFVGGLNTNTVTRDDVIQLFSSYGTILGVTLFKGYAFVQYSTLSEADLAVSALNLYHWHGSALDVKIVAKDQKAGALAAGSSNGTVGKRPAQNEQSNEAKKGRPQSNSSLDIMCELREEISDVFVCGVCRFTTSLLENFISHRKNSCDVKSGRKLEGEPDNYECNSCIDKFITCWELIEHLSKCHNLAVYRDALLNASLEKKDVKAEIQ